MASISFDHAIDHAVVLFVGKLDWEASHQLVSTIETVADHYFYSEIEIIVVSPGGDTRALRYYLDALRHWQARGIRFRTRVISTAASAAAVMVSLGDERVAEPGARLVYHHARAQNADDITAAATAELHAALRAVDEHMIALIVDRVLADPTDAPEAPFEAERSDRQVPKRLHRGSRPPTRRTRPPSAAVSSVRSAGPSTGPSGTRTARPSSRSTGACSRSRPPSPPASRVPCGSSIGSNRETAEELGVQRTPGLVIPRCLHPSIGGCGVFG